MGVGSVYFFFFLRIKAIVLYSVYVHNRRKMVVKRKNDGEMSPS